MRQSGDAVVLVRPRNPLNIGAAARAAANFGVADLRVVSPHPPVWDEALRSGVGAEILLRSARVYGGLRAAVADRTLVLATTSLKARRPALRVYDLPDLPRGTRRAFVFGPEKTGLSAADLACWDAAVRIPTAPGCSSMNLAAAAAVFCYEASRAPETSPEAEPRVCSDDLERLIGEVERALVRIGYRQGMRPEARKAKARRLLRRRGVAPAEAGFLHEVLRRII